MSESTSTLYRIIQERRSIRRFDGSSIPPEVLQRVLEAATMAPSAHNRQPWRFVIITTMEDKRSLANALGERLAEDRLADGDDPGQIERDVAQSIERISNAPVVVIGCLSMEDMDIYPDERRITAEYNMAVQSVSMAAQNLLLAAHAEGLGACWLCAPLFAKDLVREELSLPEGWEPQGLIILGYPAEAGQGRPRRLVDEVSIWR
ncbi:MAG: nitroreductase family protein [Anaerolineales bacterium]|nr:MAG: nitroreductase family protein [Anaerolineales bacterium]